MKTLSNNIASLEKTAFVEQTKEVKEIFGTDSTMKRHKTFSAADLWNLQRQVKYRAQRRFL